MKAMTTRPQFHGMYGRFENAFFKVIRYVKGKGNRCYETICKACGNTFFAPPHYFTHCNSCGCKKSLPPGEAQFNKIWSEYVKAAARRGIAWALSRDQFRALIVQDCFYCGEAPSQVSVSKKNGRMKSNGAFTYNGIDRVNSEWSYVIDNCVPCCKACNYSKKSRTQRAFLDWIARAHTHLKVKGLL